MYGNIKARDIMTTRLVTLRPSDDIYQGLQALLAHRISGAPVVTEAGIFLGVFNEKSCMNVVIDDQYHGVSNTQVNTFMFTDVRTITPETSLIDIAMLFHSEPLRRLPVLEDGKLVGLVSRRDVLRAVDTTLKKAGIRRKGKSIAPMPYYSALIDPLDNDRQA
ncbi:MAG: CBS domain-containing protein [Deltaproteobacteria bacterium]|nr:CBS domain-containing protein [Deltaproteobacteria bacterium]